MAIHNNEDDAKLKVRHSNCSISHTTIQNINYDNNNQDLLSLNSQSQLGNCFSLYCLSNNCLRLYHQNIRGLQTKQMSFCALCLPNLLIYIA